MRTTKNKGISLIVLVITIIVMIIFTTTIILSLNNSEIIGNASTAVERTNLQQIRYIAELEWANAYLEYGNNVSQKQVKEAIVSKLEEQNIDLTLYDIVVTKQGVVVDEVLTIEEICKQYDVEYYSTLKAAVTDVNDETIGKNADATKENAFVGIYVDNGTPVVILLKDITQNESLRPCRNMTLNLGGRKLTVNAMYGLEGNDERNVTVTVDGRLEASKFIVNGTSDGGRIIQTRANTFIVKGGDYELLSVEESENLANCVFYANSGGQLEIRDCNIVAYTEDDAQYTSAIIYGIAGTSNSKLIISNCNMNLYSAANNCKIRGIANYGEVIMNNCNIFTDATTSSVNAKPKSISLGMINGGVAVIEDCYVYGTHSGIQTSTGSKTYVIRGVMESPGHGGFYFSHGASGEAYIEGTRIAMCEYKGKYDNFTINSNGGLYIGSSSDAGNNLVVNFNNCIIENPKGPAIVLSSSYGGISNTVRISNSTITTSHKVRIDSDTHKIFIGPGCNFTADDTNRPAVVTVTDEVYTKK